MWYSIINILVFIGVLSYGHGLGDLRDFFVTLLSYWLIVILTKINWKKNSALITTYTMFNILLNSNIIYVIYLSWKHRLSNRREIDILFLYTWPTNKVPISNLIQILNLFIFTIIIRTTTMSFSKTKKLYKPLEKPAKYHYFNLDRINKLY